MDWMGAGLKEEQVFEEEKMLLRHSGPEEEIKMGMEGVSQTEGRKRGGNLARFRIIDEGAQARTM
jgi:hypothetical protein